MYLQEQQRGFRRLHVGREVGLDAGFFLAAEGRVGEDHVHPLAVADLGDAPLQCVAVGDLRRFQAVQQQVHLRQHVGQRLGLLPNRVSRCRVRRWSGFVTCWAMWS
jgi:hypothetical protein